MLGGKAIIGDEKSLYTPLSTLHTIDIVSKHLESWGSPRRPKRAAWGGCERISHSSCKIQKVLNHWGYDSDFVVAHGTSL